ncbi:lactate utilization protein C [Tessaracoccus sp. HDW20]|uniref:LutC/YkgG family protein n=1 Tax=Tessaracoccus coleopterorum TaxID=2714950 RepID=UPI0018D282C9|nr:lactate utilization protein C [Tessaracoccus coleopterorum]NHB83693.1 lactate utilization protein C [Tessaracoccus coleopterorum]
MSAREEILRRIRRATTDVAQSDPAVDVPVHWSYGQALSTVDVLADFVEKVEDYKARVVRVDDAGVGRAIVEALEGLGATSAVLPDGLPAEWVEAVAASDVEVHRDDPELSYAELNVIGAVVTTAAVGMADSGTIALDHGSGQGRRVLSLLPDCHVCVVRAEQVVSDVPEGIARLAPALRARRPVTWLSGGSATSDIELSRVEGVHGPRHLWVILVD